MTEHLSNATLGDIVAGDFRAAAVLERFGIDFYGGGRLTLAAACRASNADVGAVARALDALPLPAADEDDMARWPAGRLIDFIVSTHHEYVRSALPIIARDLATVEAAHGTRHPELARVAAYFDQMRSELTQHLMKEEQVLFPYLRELAAEGNRAHPPSPFGTVENPIRMMEREHRDAAEALRLMRELTNGFTSPPDGCATYAVCMAGLAAFERDLLRHVHLEDNVLFPKAVELESATRHA